jgi:hypothetical protein
VRAVPGPFETCWLKNDGKGVPVGRGNTARVFLVCI